MVKTLAENLLEARTRIEDAARRSGRDPAAVRLMAVTKGFPRDTVLEALQAGTSLFGENRVQEAEEKFAGLDGCETHLIGHLQTNKARTAAALFSCVQSIDSVHTAEALGSRCTERGRTMDVLLELNTSGEASKSGFPGREGLRPALDLIEKLPSLRVRGLMTVGPLTDDREKIRASFALLRQVFEELQAGRAGFDVLSMGMSADFEIAVEEGATLVRLGTALFGPRNAR
jgi:pyridoxal phosphate enzyme (YggS family)